MAQNEEGEFELVLGNKELLSVLFIVVVLLGVFFAMGYVVGRNSTPVDAARRSEPYVRTDAPSAMPERRTQRETASTKSEEPVSSSAAVAAEPTSTQAPNPATSAVSARTIEVGPVSTAEPQVGQTFLQVSAVAKPEAEILTELLVKKGFHAIVAPGPTDKLYRVLVGPAKDTAELGKLKADLELAGFKSIVRKY
jgi:cell division septation protein DedD